ncbi:FIST signal transduction protein [Methylocapsa acidiphila]|uniref:FIST signal transduction protein n=1 Tax=Methylocapsa acidiphila TaxID=133552 RepID=UPI00047B5F2E|nr:FIST C-terminal domain-containing protein [Methylocapsa acidiphila]
MATDRFRAALAVDDDPARAAARLAEDLAAQGEGGSIGFVYATDRLEGGLAPVIATLAQRTGVARWVGTIGFGVIGGEKAVFDRPAVAAMIATWPEDQFKLFDREDAQGFAGGLATAIVHVDPRQPYEDSLLRLAESSGAYLLGGVTASRTRSFDRVAGGVAEGGLSGLLLGPGIEAAVGVSQGCSALGPVRTIESVENGLIAKLDGETPLHALLEDLSHSQETDARKLLLSLHVGLPASNSDTGDYVVRNILGIDAESGRIGIAEHVEPGQKLFFCRRDRTAAAKDLSAMAHRLRKRKPAARGALYVSCCARGPNLFDSADEEVDLIRSALGEVPLVGFYANGEIAGDRIYGYTGVLALF